MINESGEIVDSCELLLSGKASGLPNDGFEQDPVEIYEKQLSSLEAIISNLDDPKTSILGISIANQRESIISWDKNTLKPIYPLISWQDNRYSDFSEKYRAYSDLVKEKTGLQLNNYFSASKISGILKNVDYPIENLRVGTVDCGLLANLTAGECFYTDVTNASRTLLFNLETEDGDPDLLRIFDIPRHILPEIKPSAYNFGYGKGIPILGMIGDQQASLLSLGLDSSGLNCTFGTGLFLMSSTGKNIKRHENGVTTVGGKIKDQPTVYALESGSYICGNYLDKKFDRNNLSNLICSDSVEPNFQLDSGLQYSKIFFYPFSHKILDILKYHISNIEYSTKEKYAKECINTIALITYELVTNLFVKSELNLLNISGGLSGLNYLKQVISGLLNLPVCSSIYTQTTAIGAAYLAFLYLGKLSYSDIRKNHNNFLIFWNSSKPCENILKLKQNWLDIGAPL